MFKAFKRRVARSMAQHKYIQRLVKEGLHKDEAFLAQMRLRFRNELLEANELPDIAWDVLRANLGRMEELIRNPDFFEAVLRRYSRNPEALYRLLQRAPLRNHLKAQGEFLLGIAQNRELAQEILTRIPPEQRKEAMLTLLRQDAGIFDEIAQRGPMALAVLLTQARLAGQGDVPDGEREALRTLSCFIDSHRAAFVTALTQNSPQLAQELLADPSARDQILQAIAADPRALAQVMTLATLYPCYGDGVAERLRSLLALLTDMPAFRAALHRDLELRKNLADLLRDGLESLGQPFEYESVSA